MMPRYWPELAPPEEEVPSSRLLERCGAMGVASRSMDERFEWVGCEEVFRRLISTPRKAKGAQQATDHDLHFVSRGIFEAGMNIITYTPQTAMMMVALLRLVTKGAMIMLPAKIQWATVHAVSRLGLYFSSSDRPAMLFGGRGVKLGP
jgi:hypothetical protein